MIGVPNSSPLQASQHAGNGIRHESGLAQAVAAAYVRKPSALDRFEEPEHMVVARPIDETGSRDDDWQSSRCVLKNHLLRRCFAALVRIGRGNRRVLWRWLLACRSQDARAAQV
jgi:hypothetical protein